MTKLSQCPPLFPTATPAKLGRTPLCPPGPEYPPHLLPPPKGVLVGLPHQKGGHSYEKPRFYPGWCLLSPFFNRSF